MNTLDMKIHGTKLSFGTNLDFHLLPPQSSLSFSSFSNMLCLKVD